MSDKCIICNREILNGDIFMKIDIDMHRLIYNEFESEENFLVPDGPVRSKMKFFSCDKCFDGIMESAPKDIAIAIIESKYMRK